MPVKLTTGQRIAKARETYRLSQAQLGANLGVTRAAISQYEQDRIRPRAKVIDRLAELFNSDPEWFEHGRGKAPSVLNAPLTLTEINAERLTSTADPRDCANGREWKMPLAVFAGTNLSAHDHMVVIRAPNGAGPIWPGDCVMIDTQRHEGEGIALVVSAEGPQLVSATLRSPEMRVIGYAIAYLRAI